MELFSLDNNEIQELEKEIEDLERQMPKHSVSPAMILKLEELEEALAVAISKVDTYRG